MDEHFEAVASVDGAAVCPYGLVARYLAAGSQGHGSMVAGSQGARVAPSVQGAVAVVAPAGKQEQAEVETSTD